MNADVDGVGFSVWLIIVPCGAFVLFLGYWLLGYLKVRCAYCGEKLREKNASRDTRIPRHLYCHPGMCAEKYLNRIDSTHTE